MKYYVVVNVRTGEYLKKDSGMKTTENIQEAEWFKTSFEVIDLINNNSNWTFTILNISLK